LTRLEGSVIYKLGAESSYTWLSAPSLS